MACDKVLPSEDNIMFLVESCCRDFYEATVRNLLGNGPATVAGRWCDNNNGQCLVSVHSPAP